MRKPSIVFALMLFGGVGGQQTLTDRFQKVINRIVEAYNAADYVGIQRDFSEEMLNALPLETSTPFFQSLLAQYGKIQKLDSPQLIPPSQAIFAAHFERGILDIKLVLDNQDKIIGLLFLPPSPQISYPEIDKNTTVGEIAKTYISLEENVGLVIGVVKQGRTRLFSYGKVAKDSDIQPDGNTIFEIGSITKVFTTTVLADMINDGLVDLNDPIQKYLPNSIKAPTYDNKEITLLHLATHTSALPCLPDNLEATIKDVNNPYANYTVNDLYQFLSKYKITKEIGEEYEYSNLGGGLLGHILALKSGMTYEELVLKRICDKLRMRDTGITLSPEQEKRSATGHSTSGEPVSIWNIQVLEGAGALRSSVNDMLRFLSANLGLSKTELTASMEICHKVQVRAGKTKIDVGLGWHISPLRDCQRVFWHNGGTGGYRSFIGFVKETKIGVVVLSNSANSVDEIGMLILKLLSV